MNHELVDDPDWDEYTKPDLVPSCNKGSHKERSLANQPNHIIFWRKLSHKQPLDEDIDPEIQIEDTNI